LINACVDQKALRKIRMETLFNTEAEKMSRYRFVIIGSGFESRMLY